MSSIRKATYADIDGLLALFDEARGTIAALGIDQWQDGYPSREVVCDDLEKERVFVVDCDGQIGGTFVIVDDGEPTYDRIDDGHWKTGDDNRDYLAIHRVAVAVAKRGCGISTAIINRAAEEAAARGLSSLRIDTHEGNVVMRRMLEKHGFVHCGTIFLQSGAKRVAYEKQL